MSAAMVVLLPLLFLAGAVAADRCPDGWVLDRDNCFWVSPFPIQWTWMGSMCSAYQEGATPASVHDIVTNANLELELEGRTAWLGLSRPDASGNWAWSDGSDLNYTYWDNKQPGHGNCTAINHNSQTGQWGSQDCENNLPAVCQLAARPNCPDQWSVFNGTCYVYNATNRVYYSSLESTCRGLHPSATGASIHSAEENAFLASLQTGTYGFWIGLHRASSSYDWSWSDGSDFNYENWYSSEPGSSDTYTYIDADSYGGGWFGTYGSTSLAVACQFVP